MSECLINVNKLSIGAKVADSMKVHLYQVACAQTTPKLEVVLEASTSIELFDRLRLVGQQEIRIEAVAAPNSEGNSTNYWLIDFIRLRFDHGPGRVNRNDPIEGFDLASDEGFGEETSALYDPSTGYLLVQYNHFGVRVGSIQEYLSKIRIGQTDTFELRPRLDESSELRLAQKSILKKVVFKVAPINMTSSMRAAGISVGRAIELNDSLNGQSIEISISAGRSPNSALSFSKVKKLIASLTSLVENDDVLAISSPNSPKAVEKFEIYGKNDINSQTEAIDMLTPKVEQNIDGLMLGSDLRYTRQSRWNALIRARNGWASIM